MTYVKPKPTYRQLRLLNWMRHPQHPSLPQNAAIDYEAQARSMHWSAAKLAEISGVYEGMNARQARGACLRDLNHLCETGDVMKWGHGAGRSVGARTWTLRPENL